MNPQPPQTKRILAGVAELLTLRSKRDAWTLVWMAFIGTLALRHCIGDAGVAALAAPIVAKIFADHRERLANIAKDQGPSP